VTKFPSSDKITPLLTKIPDIILVFHRESADLERRFWNLALEVLSGQNLEQYSLEERLVARQFWDLKQRRIPISSRSVIFNWNTLSKILLTNKNFVVFILELQSKFKIL